MTADIFSERLLAWFDRHGRKDLPWQRQSAYHTWVSEIMLQQTQVKTVIPYYLRFIQRFPEVPALAEAPLDEVLHYWSGLGYYARARNLHKAAALICSDFAGRFPDELEALMALPGIGRSTAGAILSLSAGQRQPILDGNVKRVLTRVFAIAGWPGQAAVERELWQLAERLTPDEHFADYTQAIMDLGATVCRRSKPNCQCCPLNSQCLAYRKQGIARFPAKKPQRALPEKTTRMLLLHNEHHEILLEQRPASGLWGGLWCFPQCDDASADIVQWCQQRLGIQIEPPTAGTPMRHSFSHYHLHITPIYARANDIGLTVMETAPRLWYNRGQPARLGLAAPVSKLLQHIDTNAAETSS